MSGLQQSQLFIRQVNKGSELYIVGELTEDGKDWLKIRDRSESEGFIEEDTKTKTVDSEPLYNPRPGRMNVKLLLVGLTFAVVWPFILTPRWFGLAVNPAYVVVEKGRSAKDFDCYYLTLFGESLSANCPPRNPPNATYKGPVEIKAGRIMMPDARGDFRLQELVHDRTAYEIIVPMEGLLIIGIGLLSRVLRPRDESETNAGPPHETNP